MKILSTILISMSLISFQALSCPYQSMAEIDKKLYSIKPDMNSESYEKVISLRKLGEEALNAGNIDESEKILNKALALIK